MTMIIEISEFPSIKHFYIHVHIVHIFINDIPFTGCFKFNAIGKIYIFSPKTNCREDNKVAILRVRKLAILNGLNV